MVVKNKQAAINGNAVQGEKKSYNGTGTAPNAEDQATDIQRWRLLDQRGQHTWHYLETDEEVKAWPQSTADRYHLGLPLVCIQSPEPQTRNPDRDTDEAILGPSRPSTRQNTHRLRPKRPVLLLPSPASTGQLGM